MFTRKALESDREVREILASWGVNSLRDCATFICSVRDRAVTAGDIAKVGELEKHIDYFSTHTGVDMSAIANDDEFRAPKQVFLDFIKNCLTVADPGPAHKLANGAAADDASGPAHVNARLDHMQDALNRIQTQLAINSWIVGKPPELFRDRILTLGSLLWPMAAIGTKKIRLGKRTDGGYVMLDDFAHIKGALSFGINNDDAWDGDIASRGIDVHQYDYTVDASPTPNERFSFFKERIAAPSDAAGTSLAAAVARLPDGPLLLKCDIEGAEWDVFETASAKCLRRFSQIVCEFHGFGAVGDDAAYEKMERALRALDATFSVVHVHANNAGPWVVLGGVPFPSVVEVTFANRAHYTFEETSELFPTEHDFPNAPSLPELYLGSFRYRSVAPR